MAQLFKLGEVVNGKQLASGLFAGMEQTEGPLWTDGQNIVFDEGVVKKIPGKAYIANLGETIYGIAQGRVNDVNRIYAGTTTSLKLYENGIISTIGTGYTGHAWSLCTWGDWLIATNNADFVQIWKNESTASALSGTPFNKCKLLEKIGPFLLAINTSEGDRNVTWCDEGNPEYWPIDDTTSAAGTLPVNEFTSEIVSSCKLGDGICVFSREELALFKYIGGVGVFGYKFLGEGGAVSKAAAISVGSTAYVMSRRAVYVTDGYSTQDIDLGIIRKWIQDNVLWEDIDTLTSVHDEVASSVSWWVPTINGTVGLTYNYASGAWTKDGFAITAADEKMSFNSPIVAIGQNLYYTNSGTDTSSEWNLISKLFDFGYCDRFKWLDGISVIASGIIKLELAFCDSTDDEIVWNDFGELGYMNFINRESVYVKMRLSGTGTFRLSSLKMLGQIGGRTI